MGLIVSVYTRKYFQEFILPPIHDADHSLDLYRSRFGLKADITLRLEVVDEVWRICPDDSYRICTQAMPAGSCVLDSGDTFRLLTEANEVICVLVRDVGSPFISYAKYDISQLDTITIGKDPGSTIRYDFRGMVSGHHAILRRQGGTWSIRNYGTNGSYLNAAWVDHQAELSFGDFINVIGLHMVFLGRYLAVDAASENVQVNERLPGSPLIQARGEPAQDRKASGPGPVPTGGRVLFHRSPRNIEKIETEEVEIENPPPVQRAGKQPLFLSVGPPLTMAIPMVLGSLLMVYASGASGGNTGLLMYSGLVMAVSSSMIGVFWALANLYCRKKAEREEETRRSDSYETYLAGKTEEIRGKYEKNANAMMTMYPEASVCAAYSGITTQLWNRNDTHDDFLTCRIGTGDVLFQVPITIPGRRFSVTPDALEEKPAAIREKFRMLHRVPVLLDLMHHPLTGIAGGADRSGAAEAARILAVQIAATHCYTDVRMAFIYNRASSDDAGQWDFAKWLPHVWAEDRKIRYIAADKTGISDVCYALTKILRERAERAKSPADRGPAKPHIVLFITDISLIREELLSKYVFDQDEALGLSVLILADTPEHLPNACEYIVQNDQDFRGIYHVSAQKEGRTAVTFDRLDDQAPERLARTLANIKVQEMETGGEIPASLTFFEMYGVTGPDQLHARERWLKNRTYDHVRGLIGQKAGGAGFFMDVHEKYYGPHGLVAGTTGSGKSETLQTFILSLAVNYSPDDVTFFIIDYKGGGMANLFNKLPHLAGQISNLSGNQVRRAMASIKSENRRRQRIFSESGVNNINAYTRLFRSREAALPVPHLFIIIDEFAELKKEEPDFMRELISVAQVGRSLGLHLVLATQKPSGTVDDNIRSNARFRLCLRVQDKEDSMDMLRKPDAAYITQTGRCCLQVGNDEVYEQFQSGWSGAPYDEAMEGGRTEPARLLTLTGRTDPAGGHMKKTADRPAPSAEKTQLDAVIEYLAAEAGAEGFVPRHQLWMPVLPNRLFLEEFREFKETMFEADQWKEPEGPWNLKIVIGKLDDPARQSQTPLHLSFTQGGHLALIGSVDAGKSTFIQTLLYAMIMRYTPQYVSIYGIDFSSRMMCAFGQAPQVGGIACEGEDQRIARLFHMLGEVLAERKKLLRGGNYSQYVQANGVILPAILLVIDNYSSFKEKTEDRYENQIITLSKEGVSHGIFMVITAGGFSMSELPGRIGENMRTVIALELPDRFAYADALHTMKIDVLPETGVKGRGLAWNEGRLLEFQTALALEAEDDYQRMEHIADRAGCMAAAWKGRTAGKIPEIPEKPVWLQFGQLEEVISATRTNRKLPVGYDESNAAVYSIDLSRIYCFLITGNAHTGKRNCMRIMILSSRMMDSEIYVIDGSNDMSMLSGFADLHFIHDADELFRFFMEELTPVFAARNRVKKALEEKGAEDEELYEALAGEKPVFIYIPDLVWFVHQISLDERNMAGFMENLITKGRFHNIYFIACLSLESRSEVTSCRVFHDFTGYRTGIHFGGNTLQNPFMDFDYLDYREQSAVQRPGIGRLPAADGEHVVERIVVPLARIRERGEAN